MNDINLIYRNKKTNSYINYLDDVEGFSYLIKMMKYNDERILKIQRQKLVNVLTNLELMKGSKE